MQYKFKWDITISSSQKTVGWNSATTSGAWSWLSQIISGPQRLHVYIIDNNNLFYGWKYYVSERRLLGSLEFLIRIWVC